VSDAECPNLPIRGAVAVQEQEIGYPLVTAGQLDAGLSHYGDASHDEGAR
jgi:hypothetical protein